MSKALCFDVYGSTHNQHSTTVERIREMTGVANPIAERVSRHWADEQLRYSFELTMMGEYETWWTLAERALEYALAYSGLEVDSEGREWILEAYQHLEPYEDWEPFEQLAAEYDLYILSDGNPDMLETLARNTGFADYLTGVVSAHGVQQYKPRPAVYEQMEQAVEGGLGACEMVATHHFDVVGAMNAGMDGTLVNRFGTPTERLGFDPDRTVDTYAELADVLC